MNYRKVDEYIKRLKRREAFLEERALNKEVEKSHYDRAELAALSWAIRYVEDTFEAAAEHQNSQWRENDEQDKLSQ